MKFLGFILTVALLTGTSFIKASAQDANSILGTYLTENGRGKVKIAKEGNQYTGTLIWTARNGATDSKNPNKAEQSKPLVGKKILTGLVYDNKKTWEKGSIYDPESGNTYSCKITRQSDGSLKVRGFLGVSLLGRTSIWTKSK
ncbi:MAG: DUF2147 domain-containing protein [Prevotella sp.]|nr:DUF2147 domain-containing protein [Prevotella sp.]MDD7461692.1 DUF2147 domain-containing protein [Prevotellaceae bacterium]MDY3365248.1 DUF2147 domain-containing protein [Prevotella sp.]MDY3853208.1 DUF2147 domain-containing protein [Prevotella sp.]